MRAAAALQSGEVLVSNDGGLGWRTTLPLPGRPLVTALLLMPRALLVGTAGRGLVRADGADRWLPASPGLPPGRTVLTLAHHDGVVLAGTLRAGVFRSTDGGQRWSPANTGLPLHGEGLEVSQLAVTPGRWYALHPFGISESRDGGLRWHAVAAGLPPHRGPSVLAVAGGVLYADVGHDVYRLGVQARWLPGAAQTPIRLVGHAGDALLGVLSGSRSLRISSDAGATWRGYRRGFPPGVTATAVEATLHAVLVALDGEGLWGRRIPPEPDAVG
jgi:hypothetical protein